MNKKTKWIAIFMLECLVLKPDYIKAQPTFTEIYQETAPTVISIILLNQQGNYGIGILS